MRVLFAFAIIIACTWSCGSSESPTLGHPAIGGGHAAGTSGVAGNAGTAGTPGSGGSGGIPLGDAGPSQYQCAWPSVVGGAGGSIPCDGTWQNPSECPAAKPQPGSPCTGDVTCYYGLSVTGMESSHCISGAWQESSEQCSGDCEVLDASIETPVLGSCGAEEVTCGGWGTDYERLLSALKSLAVCCGAPAFSEFSLTIHFANGCASNLSLNWGGSWSVPCIAKSLAGKRIDCALTQACVEVVFTTLQ